MLIECVKLDATRSTSLMWTSRGLPAWGLNFQKRPDGINLSSYRTGVPPPDLRLLTLHTTCARASCTSGAVESLDELDRDAEGIRVLAFDGSATHLFRSLVPPCAFIHGAA